MEHCNIFVITDSREKLSGSYSMYICRAMQFESITAELNPSYVVMLVLILKPNQTHIHKDETEKQ